MKYVEAPHPYRPLPDDGPSIFLAGGITGCEDWQRQACRLLGDAAVVVFNPRRAHYDPASGDTYEQQVSWEQRYLGLADVTLFWFAASDPQITVQPVALLELGFALADAGFTGRSLVVGVDDHYPRRIDVELQWRGRFPGTPLHRDLNSTVAAALAVAGRPPDGGVADEPT